MRSLIVISVLLFSTLTLGQTERRLPNGQLAYYGQDFYQRKVTKDSLYKILNEKHSITSGKHDSISTNCQSTCYRHTSVGYDGARKILFGEIYVQNDRRGTYVQDVYCGKKFYYRSLSEVSGMHTEVNIEHTWPQSKFNGNFEKNMQKSDMHHLYLTDSMANNRRGNHSFGDIGNTHDELNVQDCERSKLGDIKGHFIFTPPKEHRGNVARSLFYFATRYKLFIHPAEEIILRQWHKMDPVDEAEKARHEMIAKHQKVRNPFIDFPELVEKVADF